MRGPVMGNIVLTSGVEVAVMVSPSASMARLTMGNLRPVPFAWVCKWFLTR